MTIIIDSPEFISMEMTLKQAGILENIVKFSAEEDYYHFRLRWHGEEVVMYITQKELDMSYAPTIKLMDAIYRALFEHWHLKSSTDETLEEWLGSVRSKRPDSWTPFEPHI